jgi:hypothetical protein
MMGEKISAGRKTGIGGVRNGESVRIAETARANEFAAGRRANKFAATTSHCRPAPTPQTRAVCIRGEYPSVIGHPQADSLARTRGSRDAGEILRSRPENRAIINHRAGAPSGNRTGRRASGVGGVRGGGQCDVVAAISIAPVSAAASHCRPAPTPQTRAVCIRGEYPSVIGHPQADLRARTRGSRDAGEILRSRPENRAIINHRAGAPSGNRTGRRAPGVAGVRGGGQCDVVAAISIAPVLGPIHAPVSAAAFVSASAASAVLAAPLGIRRPAHTGTRP